MKKYILYLIAIVAFCSCNTKDNSKTSSKSHKTELSKDSICSWFAQHYTNEVTICIPDTLDSIVSKFITDIYPKEHEMIVKDGYKNISVYIGTDGVSWAVYEKFISKEKGVDEVHYVRWSNDPLGVEEISKEDFPSEWYRMSYVDGSDESKEVPSPFKDDSLFAGMEYYVK